MSVIDIDNTVVRGIKYLHSQAPDSQYYLGLLLDEAIKSSNYDINTELNEMLNSPPVYHEYPTISVPNYEPLLQSPAKKDAKLCSNSELELDLLKEDLACIVCKGMDVAAKNQLLECCKCQVLYHQECHTPPVSQDGIDTSQWTCNNCKPSNFEVSEHSTKDVHKNLQVTTISATKQSEEKNKKRRRTSSSDSSNEEE